MGGNILLTMLLDPLTIAQIWWTGNTNDLQTRVGLHVFCVKNVDWEPATLQKGGLLVGGLLVRLPLFNPSSSLLRSVFLSACLCLSLLSLSLSVSLSLSRLSRLSCLSCPSYLSCLFCLSCLSCLSLLSVCLSVCLGLWISPVLSVASLHFSLSL